MSRWCLRRLPGGPWEQDTGGAGKGGYVEIRTSRGRSESQGFASENGEGEEEETPPSPITLAYLEPTTSCLNAPG